MQVGHLNLFLFDLKVFTLFLYLLGENFKYFMGIAPSILGEGFSYSGVKPPSIFYVYKIILSQQSNKRFI